jgi:hypothetical protein
VKAEEEGKGENNLHCVTPVLQLGWVGIDLIDSDVIIF